MANADPPTTKFADSGLLSRALSSQLAANLSMAIAARGLASLVVSGGKSPIKMFELLRAEKNIPFTATAGRIEFTIPGVVDHEVAALYSA